MANPVTSCDVIVRIRTRTRVRVRNIPDPGCFLARDRRTVSRVKSSFKRCTPLKLKQLSTAACKLLSASGMEALHVSVFLFGICGFMAASGHAAVVDQADEDRAIDVIRLLIQNSVS